MSVFLLHSSFWDFLAFLCSALRLHMLEEIVRLSWTVEFVNRGLRKSPCHAVV